MKNTHKFGEEEKRGYIVTATSKSLLSSVNVAHINRKNNFGYSKYILKNLNLQV